MDIARSLPPSWNPSFQVLREILMSGSPAGSVEALRVPLHVQDYWEDEEPVREYPHEAYKAFASWYTGARMVAIRLGRYDIVLTLRELLARATWPSVDEAYLRYLSAEHFDRSEMPSEVRRSLGDVDDDPTATPWAFHLFLKRMQLFCVLWWRELDALQDRSSSSSGFRPAGSFTKKYTVAANTLKFAAQDGRIIGLAPSGQRKQWMYFEPSVEAMYGHRREGENRAK